MIFRIGDKIKLGGNEGTGYFLQSPVEGITSPNIRSADGMWAGRDGGYVSAQFYGFRTITLTGFYKGNSCEEADKLRLGLMTNLGIRKLFPVFITNFSGRHYYTEAYITDIKSDITSPLSGEWKMTLLCPDPIIYDGGDGIDSNSAWFQYTFQKEKPGGYKIESKYPVQWKEGNIASVVNNAGSVEIYPQIILRGKFTNPKITNTTTKKHIKILKTTAPSDEILIDMNERIITLNGETIASYKTNNSTWWNLLPGENRILLETDDKNDTDFGVIKFKNGYEGI